MDLGYASSCPLPASLAPVSARAAAFLAGGGRAAVLSGPSGSGKAAVIEQLVAGMPGRVLRVRNPGPGPLDLAAMLQQLGQVPADQADEQGTFFRTLAALAYDDYSAVLAIEDAHTLTGFTLSALSRVPGLGGPDLPGLVLLLSGEPELLAKMAAPGLEQLRNPRRTLLLKLSPIAEELEAEPAVRPVPGEAAVRERRLPRFRHDLRVAALAAAGGGLITAAMALAWPAARGLDVDGGAPASAMAGAAADLPAPAMEATMVTPDPVAAEPAAVAARAPAADQGTPMPAGQQMRHEFDGFLDRAGRDTAKLTPVARQNLFEEYLRWRGRKPPGRAPQPPADPRVVPASK